MIETADRAPVRELDRVVDPADALLDQRERPPAGAALLRGRGTHEVSAAIADQRHRHVVEPRAHQLEQAVIGRQHLDVGIIGQEVVAPLLARADGGYALELSVPVEYPAAEGGFDFPAPRIRK